MDTPQQSSTLRQAIEIAINLGLIFIIIAWCFQIVRPFISFIIWGGVSRSRRTRPFSSSKARSAGGKNWR